MIINAKEAFNQDTIEALVQRAQQGEQVAFEQLYQQCYRRVYGLCLRLLADQAHAEDATQEVFVQLWHKIAQFQGQSKFTTWLHSVTSNVAISYLRKQKNWLQKVVSLEDSGMEQTEIAQCESLNGLDKLVLRLPERARLVFVLHAVEGYRHEEVAGMLNMAVGSSKSQFHRARKLLQEWYDNE
ncbi:MULTISPECIES: sigma-70 family RNA polymerase sigma factor [unclassified Pseudoalteromonas]|uniref:RNA polymerase sigma factor n=1 Tax=unclassified Pseudoalteromonas TaxID=194690 RepID=UPI0020983AC0|nr:sigma-70 family RNA polymerase sigma factor [Pseudoalteromonas sp. XMcav2-N]MCO7189810.1 sigma-70 family RNA polymerase sigma factor [Pseudoalteromonas sp. XMcav2-N]